MVRQKKSAAIQSHFLQKCRLMVKSLLEAVSDCLPPTGKNKEVSGESVQFQMVAHQRRQTVKALTHIARREAELSRAGGAATSSPNSTI
jgi:hypothetical protein